MKNILLMSLILQATTAFTQKYTLELQAGANTSFLTKGHSSLVMLAYTEPNYSDLETGAGAAMYGWGELERRTQPKVGFYVDGQIKRNLTNNWKMLLSVGLNQLTFYYDIELPNTTQESMVRKAVDVFGENRFLYLSSRFLNIGKQWGKLEVQAGPVLNYLLHKKYANYIEFKANEDDAIVRYGILEDKGALRKFVAGADLAMQYEIVKKLAIQLRGQKFFTSVYEKEHTSADIYKKGKPLQLLLGISYQVRSF